MKKWNTASQSWDVEEELVSSDVAQQWERSASGSGFFNLRIPMSGSYLAMMTKNTLTIGK